MRKDNCDSTPSGDVLDPDPVLQLLQDILDDMEREERQILVEGWDLIEHRAGFFLPVT